MEETTIQTPVTEDPAMDEHRAALTKMRCDYALEQLYQSSGARDPAILCRLIDVGEDDITVGEDGVPDVSAVKDKIDMLRREQGYLFCDAPDTQPPTAGTAPAVSEGVGATATGVRLGVMQKPDYAQMDDASYYRAVLARKGMRRR